MGRGRVDAVGFSFEDGDSALEIDLAFGGDVATEQATRLGGKPRINATTTAFMVS